jgi:hypothetical protein
LVQHNARALLLRLLEIEPGFYTRMLTQTMKG